MYRWFTRIQGFLILIQDLQALHITNMVTFIQAILFQIGNFVAFLA